MIRIKNLSTKYEIDMKGLLKIVKEMVDYGDAIDLYIIDVKSNLDRIPMARKYNVRNKKKSIENYIECGEQIVLLSHVDFTFKMRYDGYQESLDMFDCDKMYFKETFSVIHVASIISMITNVMKNIEAYKNNIHLDKVETVKTKDIIKSLALKYNSNPDEYSYIFKIVQPKC